METEMNIDGKKTGVKLDLDLNALFKFLVGTAIVAAVGYMVSSQVSTKDMLYTMSTQISIIQVKLEQSEKANANFVTADQMNARGKLRDLQFTTLESRVNALESRVTAIQPQPIVRHQAAP